MSDGNQASRPALSNRGSITINGAAFTVQLTVCRFKPANVLSEGFASGNAKQYSLFVGN
jgi:hypothetical protein